MYRAGASAETEIVAAIESGLATGLAGYLQSVDGSNLLYSPGAYLGNSFVLRAFLGAGQDQLTR